MTKYLIGLMSGTSMDAVDSALVRFTDAPVPDLTRRHSIPVPISLREELLAVAQPGSNEIDRMMRLDADVARLFALAVGELLAKAGLKPSQIQAIGSHGQTIRHVPDGPEPYTVQIGNPSLIAELTGIATVADFRRRDMAAGGQGAPLVPVYHQALAAGRATPLAFLNIGGVANVTYVGAEVIAFDTGPGNALIDDWMLQKTGQKHDENGATAARGKVNETVLRELLNHKFFCEKPPKSLDRNDLVSSAWKDLSVEDGAATLAAYTAGAVENALFFLPEKPKEWIVAGGGRLNATIMKMLRERLGVPVISIDDIGLNGDAIEAEAFAYMAVRSYRGLPISFPKTTGVPQPMVGGKLNHVAAAA